MKKIVAKLVFKNKVLVRNKACKKWLKTVEKIVNNKLNELQKQS